MPPARIRRARHRSLDRTLEIELIKIDLLAAILRHFVLGKTGVPTREDLPAVRVVGEVETVGAVVVVLLLLVDHRRVVSLRRAFNRARGQAVADRALGSLDILLRIDPRPARRDPLCRLKRLRVLVITL